MAELTVEQMSKQVNDNIEKLKSSINEKADLSVLEDKFEGINKQLEGFDPKEIVKLEDFNKTQEQLDDISTQLKQLSEYQKGKATPISEQVMRQLKSDDFKAAMSKAGVGRGANIEVKAANIDTGDINSGTIESQVETGVAKAPWRPTPLWDRINKGIIGQGRDQIAWWEETTRTDSAEMVAENAAPSAGSAKTFTKQSMDIKLIKDYTKVSKSALEDFEYINSEVQDLIGNGIPRLRETQLMDGTGLTVYLKGITEYAKTFAKPSNFDAVSNPNNGDVLAAAALQIMNGNTSDSEKKGYMPNAIFVNPGDMTNMRLIKDANYNYLRHPLLSEDGSRFQGIEVVPTLDLSAGTYVIGDFSRAKAYVKRAMNISFHYENEDDVLNDLVLVLASMRIAGLKVAAPDEYAFVTGTFTAGKTAITA